MKIKHFLFACVLILLSSCGKNKFTIDGTIENSEQETVYLENLGLTKTVVMDSAVIKNNGHFKFRAPRPDYPDLYRLRMGNQQFVFSVDSCEHITIVASADSLSFPAKIEGSENTEQITRLRTSLAGLQRIYNRVLNEEIGFDTLTTKIAEHKEMAQQIILANPRSIVAYYALFQKMEGYFMFSPYGKEDRPYYSAVATSFHTFMPKYERSINLYNLVMEAIRTERQLQNEAVLQTMIDNAESTTIDIELPNQFGNVRKLSDLKGQVVLLDFSVYEAENSIAYTFELRELYNKFAPRGFEIFQVSADRNNLLWEQSVENLPWICVRGNGVYEPCFTLYNVQKIPTTFLIDKNGDILERDVPFDQLPAKIEKLLNK